MSPVISSFSLHSWHWTWAFINRPALETFSRDLTIQPEISLPPLSFSLSLYLTLSLALHPSLPVRSCPPSHLSCNVYGPFCFCVLMTTVTESYPLPMRPDERCYPDALLTPLCPWPQRRCLASQLAASKEWGRGRTWGSWTEDLSVILQTGCSYTSPPSSRQRLPSPLYPANGNMGLVSMAMAMMLSLILRCWIVPLPFTWIYIYIWTDTVRDPRAPPEATQGALKG